MQDNSLNKKKKQPGAEPKGAGEGSLKDKGDFDLEGVTPTIYVKQKFDGENLRPNLHHQYMPVDQTIEDNLAGLNNGNTAAGKEITQEDNDDDDDDSDEDLNQPMEMRCPHCGNFGLTKIVKVCTCKTILIWILTIFLFILCSCCICLFPANERR